MEQIKVGDILYGMWHYSMHFPVFFRVTKVTAKTATAELLFSKCVRATDDGYGQQGYEVPDFTRCKGEKLGRIEDDYVVVGSKWDTILLKKWDGQPVWADYMD